MSIVIAHDATHKNIAHLPPGQAAGYTTGTAEVKWTEQDWAAHPGAVRIDQDATASDPTADELDVERGAATYADCPGWVRRARSDYKLRRRPGQRTPAIYASASNIPAVVNALIGGGITSGVGLHVANWNLTEPQAVADVLAAAGPFPVIGVQFKNNGLFDTDVYSGAWLAAVSTAGPYRHVTGIHESLAEIAHRRGVSVEHLFDLMARHYTPADVAEAAAVRAHGIPYYTMNP